jgi:hypothetical protein
MVSSQSVEKGDEFYHVRYRDPDEFDTIRTPDWAARVGESVSSGSEVRMGQERESDEWEVQSVLIHVDSADEDEAEDLADEIVRKIED